MKPLIISLALLAVGITAWQIFLRPEGPNGRSPDAPPGQGDPDQPDGPDASLPPDDEVRTLLTAEKTGQKDVRPRLKDLAKTVKGAKKLILLIPTLPDPEDQALVFLLLVQGGTKEGVEFATAAAEEPDGKFRVPAILGLAGGDAESVELLARLLAGTEEEGLVRALAFALVLNGSDGALRSLDRALSTAESSERRMMLYEALSGTPPGLPVGNRFVAMLGGMPERQTDRPGYRGLVDRLSRESDPAAIPAAATILAGMPGPAARDATLRLWRDTEGPVREEVFNALLGAWSADRKNGARSLLKVAMEARGPDSMEARRRVLEGIRDARDPDLVPLLEEWMQVESDPDLKERLGERVRELREER